MSIRITDECLNCGACEPQCPNSAIYEGSDIWKYSDGTNLKGFEKDLNGNIIDMDKENVPIQKDFYYVVEEKCTECISFEDEPQCAAVCPIDCCVPSKKETNKQLTDKIDWMFKGNTSSYDELRKRNEEWRKNNISSCGCQNDNSIENEAKTDLKTKRKQSKSFWGKIVDFFAN